MKPPADITAILSQRLAPLHPAVVYLFGSEVRGQGRPDSDMDIGFVADAPQDPCAVFDIAQQIADDLGRDVDLVDLRRASAVMKAQVIGTGRRVWVTDPMAADTFEMYALSQYARTNEERRESLRGFEESLHAR